MKYFTLDTVVSSYRNFQQAMTNKSWGMLSIMHSVDSVIEPGVSFRIDGNDVTAFLNDIFCISDEEPNVKGRGSDWFVIFSNRWSDYFSQAETNPNIYDVIGWAYRKRAFPDDVNDMEILQMFSVDFHIENKVIKDIFQTKQRRFSFTNHPYTEDALWISMQNIGGDFRHRNITAEGRSVVAKPGELSRGPFFQPLYAGLDTLSYLIIGQTDFSELYGVSSDHQKTNKGLISPPLKIY